MLPAAILATLGAAAAASPAPAKMLRKARSPWRASRVRTIWQLRGLARSERRGVVLLGRLPARVSDLAFSYLFSKLVFLMCSSFCSSLIFLCSKRKSVYERHLVDHRSIWSSCVLWVCRAVHHRTDDGRLVIHEKNASVNFQHVVPLLIICEHVFLIVYRTEN